MSEQYRKKPVEVSAFRMTEAVFRDVVNWPQWAQAAGEAGIIVMHGQNGVAVKVKTLEGVMDCAFGDWIIRGVKGEIYPIKPDIFGATYEPVEE